uniref:Uncharacterized protein n=1 Tax=Cacopsylla melanoneura TaxID=428564 RepID=A0A8D8S602_9HEMI
MIQSMLKLSKKKNRLPLIQSSQERAGCLILNSTSSQCPDGRIDPVNRLSRLPLLSRWKRDSRPRCLFWINLKGSRATGTIKTLPCPSWTSPRGTIPSEHFSDRSHSVLRPQREDTRTDLTPSVRPLPRGDTRKDLTHSGRLLLKGCCIQTGLSLRERLLPRATLRDLSHNGHPRHSTPILTGTPIARSPSRGAVVHSPTVPLWSDGARCRVIVSRPMSASWTAFWPTSQLSRPRTSDSGCDSCLSCFLSSTMPGTGSGTCLPWNGTSRQSMKESWYSAIG